LDLAFSLKLIREVYKKNNPLNLSFLRGIKGVVFYCFLSPALEPF